MEDEAAGVPTQQGHRPFVLINVAATVDGKLDTAERRGAAISSERDRARVDHLRADADAVMVGGHTVLGDDPRLTVKSAPLRAERVARGLSEHPVKVAVVTRPDMRPTSRFFTSGSARIIVFTTAQASTAQLAMLEDLGVETYVLGARAVDLPAALATLQALGVNRLLVEGGATLNFELLRLRLVDELHLYVAPLIFGGASAPTLAGGDGLPRDRAIQLRRVDMQAWDDGSMQVRYAVI